LLLATRGSRIRACSNALGTISAKQRLTLLAATTLVAAAAAAPSALAAGGDAATAGSEAQFYKIGSDTDITRWGSVPDKKKFFGSGSLAKPEWKGVAKKKFFG